MAVQGMRPGQNKESTLQRGLYIAVYLQIS
jgi:hypothetical protein